MGVNKYASSFLMASCNKKMCNHRKKTWRKKYEYVIVFASTQLRITRLRKYPIEPKAYLGRWLKQDRCVDQILTQILRDKDRNCIDHSSILGPDKRGHFKMSFGLS